MEGKATNRHVFLSMVREVEMSRDWLEASLSLISTSLRCSRKRSPNLRPVLPMYTFLHKVQAIQEMRLVEMHKK